MKDGYNRLLVTTVPLHTGQNAIGPLSTSVPKSQVSTYSTWSKYEVFGGGEFAHYTNVVSCPKLCVELQHRRFPSPPYIPAKT